jgi:hypothetical protein
MAGEIVIITCGQWEIVQEFVRDRKQLVTRLADVIRERERCRR